jgi:hypothetical protein
MKINTIVLFGTCISLAFSACKKDDENKTGTTPSTASIEGSWKITAQMRTTTDGTVMDMFTTAPPCMKDDLMRFNTDKTLAALAGATKCDSSEEDSEVWATWALSVDRKTLTVSDGTPLFVADVLTLNATTLKLKQIDPNDSSEMVSTLARQ